jgi:hypothetical protein
MSTVQFAGFSRTNGALKFRTANELGRADQLRKLGDTDVTMFILPSAMTKNEAAKYVLTNLAISYPTFNNSEAETLLNGLIKDENTVAKPKKLTVKKTPTVKAKNLKISPTTVEEHSFSPKEAARIRAEFMKKLKVVFDAN